MGLPRCQVSQSCIMILEGIYGPDLFPFSLQFDASDQDTYQIYWSLFFWTKLSEIRIQIQLCPDFLDSTDTTQPQFF